jgi:hypothetical protein
VSGTKLLPCRGTCGLEENNWRMNTGLHTPTEVTLAMTKFFSPGSEFRHHTLLPSNRFGRFAGIKFVLTLSCKLSLQVLQICAIDSCTTLCVCVVIAQGPVDSTSPLQKLWDFSVG